MLAYLSEVLKSFENLTRIREMKKQLNEWFQWNKIANETLLNVVNDAKNVPTPCLNVLSDIIDIHELWLNRICAIDGMTGGYTEKSLKLLPQKNRVLHEITAKFLSSSSYGEDFDWSFSYQGPSGELLSISLKDAYFQIITYSDFQRGQVVGLLRHHGIEAPKIDYLSLKER